MKSLLKSTLSIFLAVVMLFSTGFMAFADSDYDTGDYDIFIEDDEFVIDDDIDISDDSDSPDEIEDIDDFNDSVTDDFDDIEIPGEESAEEEDEGLFPGMPDGYKLSRADTELKVEIARDGLLEEVDEIVAGEDYIEGEVLLLTDSRDYAEAAAQAYGGELISYENELAVIRLPEDAKVTDAIAAAVDTDCAAPIF